MLSILHLRIILFLLVPRPLNLGRVELRKVTLVVVETLRMLMDDIGGNVI